MNILILSVYFPPQHSIASLRVYSFAKYWGLAGNQVTVLTPQKLDEGDLNIKISAPEYNLVELSHLKILQNLIRLKQKQLDRKSLQGSIHTKDIVDVTGKNPFDIFIKPLMLMKKRYFKLTTNRMPNVHDTWIPKAVRLGKNIIDSKHIDIIFSSYAPPASHIIAGILAKWSGKPWIADYRDLWIEEHVYKGMWPFTVLERYFEKKYVGNYSNIITIVSEPLANILRKKFAAPVHVIENGYDEDDYKNKFSPYFNEVKKRIVYTGTIYPGMRDPSPLFAAIDLIAKKNKITNNHSMSDFEILFFGSQEDWLDNLIKRYNVEPWVKYMGRVGRDDALRIQNQADILLFLEWENGSVDGILTGKLFEYLAQRKPILGVGITAKTSSGALIEEAGVGVAVGTDINKMVSIIENFLNTGIPFNIKPKEDVITKYTRRNQAKKLLQLMEKCYK
jgi:glycosyltransferase involved in cell wall biosynthesis